MIDLKAEIEMIATQHDYDFNMYAVNDVITLCTRYGNEKLEEAAKEGERFLESLKDRSDERRDGAFVAITRLVKSIRSRKEEEG